MEVVSALLSTAVGKNVSREEEPIADYTKAVGNNGRCIINCRSELGYCGDSPFAYRDLLDIKGKEK